MWKYLAIFVFFIIALPLTTACLLSAQTAPSNPPEKRVTTQSTGKAGSEQTKAQTSDSNNPPPSPIDIPASAHSGQKESNTEQESLDIQRKLVWFTGVLALVGVLQVITMIRQARLLRGTLEKIRVQAEQMEKQTGILHESVTASQTSANAAAAQVQLVKDKERARVRVEFEPLDLSFNPIPGGYKVRFKVFLDGPTQAYIVETHCIAEIYDPASTNYDIGGDMGLPQVITPDERLIKKYVSLFTDSTSCPPDLCDPNEERVQLAREEKLPVLIKGFIRYRDLFGDKCWVKFNLKWRYYWDFDTNSRSQSAGYWESIGTNGEYGETDEQKAN